VENWRWLGDNDADCQAAIGGVGITAAIMSLQDLVELLDPEDLAEPAGVAQILDDFVALAVDIRRDMVRDLARGMAEAHASVVGCCPHPQRAPRRVGFC
jgi:hypothetical protein